MTDQRKTAPPPLETYRPSEERGRRDLRSADRPDTAFGPAPAPSFGRLNSEASSFEPRRGTPRRALVYGGLIGAGLAAAIATFLIALPPAALIEAEIVSAVKAETGGDLAIRGGSSFRLFPSPGIAMRDVVLSAAPGMEGGPLVSMAGLEANISLQSLLDRKISIGRLVLRAPAFDLRIDKQGRRSWDRAALEVPARVRVAAANTAGTASDVTAEPSAGGSGKNEDRARVGRFTIDTLRIENGSLRYRDDRTGLAGDVTAITLDAALPSLAGPMSAKGEATWSGEALAFSGDLGSLAALLDERPASLAVTLSGPPVEMSYEGTFTLAAAPSLKGKVAAKAASAKRLAAWLGVAGPSSGGPVSIAGEIETAPRLVRLENATLDLDGSAANGSILVDTGGERPLWRADLKIAELNLNGSGGRVPAGAAAPPQASTDAPSSAQSIDDLLNRDGPKVKGYSRRAGWSEDPMDWSFLGAADADLDLDIGRVIHDDLKTGPARIKVILKDKALKATIADISLYGGHGRGVFAVNGTPGEPDLSAMFSSADVDAQAFLKDAAGLDWLAGKAKMSVALASQGASERRIIETLSGTADLKVADGTIAGIDTERMMRDLSSGKVGAAAKKPSGATGFSELTATFTIKGGVAENKDLRLRSALLDATGAGKVYLAKRELDYTIRPRLAPKADQENGAEPASGIEIPVRFAGAWESPKFSADIEGVLKEPDKAISAIKEIGKKLKGNKKLGDFVRGLLGDDGEKDGDGGEGQPREPAE